MPARDGTGPFGNGPIGRGLGPCGEGWQGNDQPFGLGLSNRRGRRFGNFSQRRGWWGNPNVPATDSQIQSLQNQQNWLKERLEIVTRKIEDLGKGGE